MNDFFRICSRIYTLHQLPLSLVDRDGQILQSWPEILKESVRPEMTGLVIQDFTLQNRDARHPLVSFIQNGFFVGAVEIEPELYVILGLCSPYRHSRKELMEFCTETVYPEQMQRYCDAILQAPILTLPQMRAYALLLAQLFTGESIPDENVLFSDSASQIPYSEKSFADARFQQREAADEHATTDFENGVCQAITLGRSDLLIRALSATPSGNVGAMSLDAQRQLRYSFISFATLISRAAIRGGLSQESAFLLSDLYCQRMDMLSERAEIEHLLVGMAMDFCDKVAKNRQTRQLSPVVHMALNFITVHLHEDFTLEDLAAHCHLCRRSLSLRFKEEVGMSVVDYVQREKIDEARFLLEHTELGLSQISSHLNYSSQSYFIAQFKKIVGETPERYRNKKKHLR